MPRRDLTDAEIAQCILSLPEMRGVDEKLITRFRHTAVRWGRDYSDGQFGPSVFDLLMARHATILETFRATNPKCPTAYFHIIIRNLTRDVQRKAKSRREARSAQVGFSPVARTEPSAESRDLDNKNERFDMADTLLAQERGKLRAGFKIAYEGIARPLNKGERAALQTGGADVFAQRLAHADKPTVAQVSESATRMDPKKWTCPELVAAFNDAAGSHLCSNAVTARGWLKRIGKACNDAQTAMQKDY